MGSKAREGAKAMSLVFVLLDFQHAVFSNIMIFFFLYRCFSYGTCSLHFIGIDTLVIIYVLLS